MFVKLLARGWRPALSWLPQMVAVTSPMIHVTCNDTQHVHIHIDHSAERPASG
jgi:hypothetical protein